MGTCRRHSAATVPVSFPTFQTPAPLTGRQLADQLARTVQSWVLELAGFQAQVEATGIPKPAYGLDGQQVDWDTYRDKMLKRIQDSLKVIQMLEGPWAVQSRAVL